MQQQTKRYAGLALALLTWLWTGTARADLITYDVTVNTATLTGTAGALEVQFNPSGPGSDVLHAALGNFTPAANLGAGTQAFGHVSGTFGTGLALDDGTGLNDFLQDFTYGNSLFFQVSFSENLSNPDPGAAFSLTLWDTSAANVVNGAGNPLLPSADPSAAALLLTLNPNSLTESSDVTVQQEGAAATPEPAALLLFGSGAVIVLGYARRRRKALSRSRGPVVPA